MVLGMTSASPERPSRKGGGLALVTILVQTISTAIAARGQEAQLDMLGYALLIVGGLLVAGRKRAPHFTAVAVAAVTVSYHALGFPSGPTFVAAVVVAGALIRAGRGKVAWATAVPSVAAWALLTQVTPGRALIALAWVVGVLIFLEVFLNVAKMAADKAREERRAAEERRRRQASEERLRIAQELHDVLGHHLSLINVRAGVGRHLMDREPEQARAALDTIKEASAEALREVQAVLNTLYPTGQAAPRAPQPRLEHLDELTVDAGLSVHIVIAGQARVLPAQIDRAAYRIVQESLTNVRRHAGVGATATITIDYTRDEAITLQVSDDGGANAPIALPIAEGNGISGMRERATTLGGSFLAGPVPEGGWRVNATLPVPGAAQEAAE
jgi:signal transduction histidine kinase